MVVPLVKICGIRNLEDALFCATAGANYLGFIFYSKSLRYIKPEYAKGIIAQLPSSVTPVGVFVNEKRENIETIVKITDIQVLQLSGDESPNECIGYPVEVWKAFRINNLQDIHRMEDYHLSTLLLDGVKDGHYGGTGTLANFDVAKEIKKTHRLILAGGLNPDNIIDAITNVEPYAVDINSGVETSPGKKDHREVKRLFEEINKLTDVAQSQL